MYQSIVGFHLRNEEKVATLGDQEISWSDYQVARLRPKKGLALAFFS